MTHVLTGGCGDIPFKGFGYFMKFPRQRERFVLIPLRYLHNLGYFLGSIPHLPQLHELLLHQVPGFLQGLELLKNYQGLSVRILLDLLELFYFICVLVYTYL
jgi:hypothetical protein